eukprot:GHVP01015435.1.p1 GENE.GHVP01015435.1~~GHVP01015435.1.p1  ORF type:complete len:133 (-),score=17.88 GHVP01015435.1:1021-1419(-)
MFEEIRTHISNSIRLHSVPPTSENFQFTKKVFAVPVPNQEYEVVMFRHIKVPEGGRRVSIIYGRDLQNPNTYYKAKPNVAFNSLQYITTFQHSHSHQQQPLPSYPDTNFENLLTDIEDEIREETSDPYFLDS